MVHRPRPNRSPAETPSGGATGRQLPIGVFDSGVGGLTVVRELRRALPREDIVYLGDTARVPYGTKSPATVIRFACEDAQFLLAQGVKALVVACNSASAWALPALRQQCAPLPVWDVIGPGAQEAVRRTRNRRIGVIGTGATIRSGAYVRAIHELAPDAEVCACACPLLVPLVEEGWLNHRVTRLVLQAYLQPLRRRRIDTLVLGCTHYPLLKPALRAVLGSAICLVDSAQSCARDVRDRLTAAGLLAGRRRAGTMRPFVTDEADRFAEFARRFLGESGLPARTVQLRALAEPLGPPLG